MTGSVQPDPRSIHGDNGIYILAADRSDARTFADVEGYVLGREVGWMHETGWNDDEYETRKQFLEESGYSSWWVGCTVVEGTKPTDTLLRAWEATHA